MTNQVFKYTLFLLLVSVSVGVIGNYLRDGSELGESTKQAVESLKIENLKPEEVLKAEKKDVLADIEVENIYCSPDFSKGCVKNGTTTQYVYASDQAVESKDVLGKKESVDLREYNSRTYILSIEKDEKGKEIVTKNTIFYAGPAFFEKDDGTWVNVEYATTTPEAFDLQMKSSFFDRLKYVYRQVFLPYQKALAQTSFTAGGNAESSMNTGDTADWATSRGAASARDCDPTTAEGWFASAIRGNSASTYMIFRHIVSFDTSTIGSGATISAAKLNYYIHTNYRSADNDGKDYLSVSSSSPSNITSLSAAEYNNITLNGQGSLHDASENIDVSSSYGSMPFWSDFDFNATGLAYINKTGYTSLSVREGHDIENEAVVGGSNYQGNALYTYFTENTGTTYDPYFSITYSAATASSKVPDIIIFD